MKEIDFKWTDELVHQYVSEVITGTIGFSNSPMDKFKASHTPEVKGVDWEIVAYTVDFAGLEKVRFKKLADGSFDVYDYRIPNLENSVSNQEELLRNKATIHSVRRLLDNVVFSVGEMIDSAYNGVFTITKIYLTEEYGDLQIMGNNGSNTSTHVIPIVSASKLPDRADASIKPPIGIMPEYIWKEQRLYELNQAIIRYINAGLSYPKEWGFERENIINETKPKQ